MPSNPELGPNDKSKTPEIRPGQKRLKDDEATRRKLGETALKGASKDKPKK